MPLFHSSRLGPLSSSLSGAAGCHARPGGKSRDDSRLCRLDSPRHKASRRLISFGNGYAGLGATSALVLFILGAPLVSAPPPALTAEEQAVLSGISPDSLRANLSFLASDDLKGRYTPSPELDIAASFIAARFRGAGLEPLGDQ